MNGEIKAMYNSESIFARMGRAGTYLEKLGELEHSKSVYNGMSELAKCDADLYQNIDKIKEYNGITPETVSEMVEALRVLKTVYDSKGQLLDFNVSIALNALKVAESELNKSV